MLFDDNDYYDYMYGFNDLNDDFHFDSNESVDNNLSSVNNDASVNESIPDNSQLQQSQQMYYFEHFTQLKEYVNLYYNRIKDYYILLPIEAIGAIRVDRRRRDYPTYLIPSNCIGIPHS